MKTRKFLILLAALALVTATLVCGLGGGELGLTNLRMALDQDGDNPTTIFSPSDDFFLVTDINNAPSGTVVSVDWSAVNVPSIGAGVINQSSQTVEEDGFTGTLYFQLFSDAAWPTGDYKVDVYLNGNSVQSLAFSVQ